jgi:hypothetical protein
MLSHSLLRHLLLPPQRGDCSSESRKVHPNHQIANIFYI